MSGPRRDRHVLILGCGYTGLTLAQRLAFRGVPVVGTTRSAERASIIRTRGAQPILFEAGQWEALAPWRGRTSAVVQMIPPAMGPGGAFEDLTAELLHRLADWGLDAFVYVSSTSVYGDLGGEIADEDTPCAPDSPRGAARRSVEARVLASALPAMVVRPAGIYGPGRSQLHRIARGAYRLVAGGESYTNRIHVSDLAAILDAAIARGEPGRIYLGSDREPATQREVVDHIVATWGLPRPADMPLAEARIRLSRDVLAMITGSKRLDPSRTLEALGITLRYPTYRAGLADVWRREGAELMALLEA